MAKGNDDWVMWAGVILAVGFILYNVTGGTLFSLAVFSNPSATTPVPSEIPMSWNQNLTYYFKSVATGSHTLQYSVKEDHGGPDVAKYNVYFKGSKVVTAGTTTTSYVAKSTVLSVTSVGVQPVTFEFYNDYFRPTVYYQGNNKFLFKTVGGLKNLSRNVGMVNGSFNLETIPLGISANRVEYYLDGVYNTSESVMPYYFLKDNGNATTGFSPLLKTIPSGSHSLEVKAFNGATLLASDFYYFITPTTTYPSPAIVSDVQDRNFYVTNLIVQEPASGVVCASDVSSCGTTRDPANNCQFRTCPSSTADTTLPSLTLNSPAAFSTVNGSVTISATASDNVGVTKVEFLIDGVLKSTDTVSPYSYVWDATNGGSHLCIGNHTHTVTAKVYDAAGNTRSIGNPVYMYNPLYCNNQTSSACSTDAKLCSDGSYVVRVSPSCNFASCPVVNSSNNNGGSCALTCDTGYEFVSPCGCKQVCPIYTYETPDCNGGQVITGGVDSNQCPLPPRCAGDNGSENTFVTSATDFAVKNWIPVGLVLIAFLLIFLRRGK